MSNSWRLGAVALAVAAVALRCHPAAVAESGSGDGEVDLPGVDTHELTARERHEWSRYVQEYGAPCTGVAVPIAQCILEHRQCKPCLTAATVLVSAVRDGLGRDQIDALYKERFDAASAKQIPLEGSPSRGPDAAAVTVVEFADFECPFCQHLAPRLDAIWEKRRNAVRFVFKFMPLSVHPHGEIAARAGVAAQAQGKFWEMDRKLFGAGTHLDESDLDAYAKEVGLDLERFHADMQSPATRARLETDRQLADRLGVKGTPTLFIDGRLYDSKEDLEGWIDGEIASASRDGEAHR